MSHAPAHALLALSASSSGATSGFFARVTESQRCKATAIELVGRMRIAGRTIDAGLYRVRVDEARERIVLENDDRTYALTAFFRRAQTLSQFPTTASLEQAEGGRSFLVVRLASGCEWIA